MKPIEIKKVAIEWETNGEKVDLPKEIKVGADVPLEDLADHLSNKYGRLVKSIS